MMHNIKSIEQEIRQCSQQIEEHRAKGDQLRAKQAQELAVGNLLGAANEKLDERHHTDEIGRLERHIQELQYELNSMQKHVAGIDEEIQRAHNDTARKIRDIEEYAKKHITELERQKQSYLG